MRNTVRLLPLLSALALSACATAPTVTTLSTDTAPPPDVTTLQAPAQVTASAASTLDASAFADATGYGQLSSRSKTAMSQAQFNALQFGRVGAPRTWNGDSGQSGSITVGPYVRVNLIDCRDFTNTVTVGGQNFVKQGTACRDGSGSWTVSAVKTS